MDYLLELALEILPDEQTMQKHNERRIDICKQLLKEAQEKAPRKPNSGGDWKAEFWNSLREERNREAQIQALTAILYCNPEFALDAAERLKHIPSFLRTLAGRAIERDAAQKSMKQRMVSWFGPAERFDLEKLLNKHAGKKISPVRRALGKLARLKSFLVYHRRYKQEDLEKLLLQYPALVRELAEKLEVAVPFSMVLEKELLEVSESRKERQISTSENPGEDSSSMEDKDTQASFEYPLLEAHDKDLLGLAFSGGGIRSATFNLGILQGLAKLGLLRCFDYLSTVSGGGYIGGWLLAWAKRSGGIGQLEQWLSPSQSPNPQDEKLRPIRFLRQYSNYLTPRTGFFSADTWAMISTWFRNTILNQLILVLIFIAALLIPRLLVSIASVLHTYSWWVEVIAIAGLAAILSAIGVISLNLRAYTKKERFRRPWMEPRRIISGVVVPVFGSAIAATAILWKQLDVFWWAFGVFFGGLSLIFFFGRCSRFFLPAEEKKTKWCFLTFIFIIPACSFAGAGLVYLVELWLDTLKDTNAGQWHALTFGPPTLIIIFSMVITLMIGLLGRNFADYRREWWSRLGGWLLIVSIVWLGLCLASIYGPLCLALIGVWAAAAGFGWIGSTVSGVLAAKGTESGGPPSALRKGIMTAAPYVFIVGLMLGLALGLQYLLIKIQGNVLPSFEKLANCYWNHIAFDKYVWLLPVLVVTLPIVALILAWRVDVNEFSMHHFYRNRLVRCYLAASRPRNEREAHPFTGFDPNDDLHLATLILKPPLPDRLPREKDKYVGPYPIINTTLNLVKGGEYLGWQERKGTSFSFTPYYSGYDYQPRTVQQPLNQKSNDHQPPVAQSHFDNKPLEHDAYRQTYRYGYSREGGPSLGATMAISGAAVNPSMGFRSSPALAFLMTMFNVRLGWWMGNPRRDDTWTLSSPKSGLTYLISELLGFTDDRAKYVNLSDGGHFENLAIYELVRRRCMFIIACDAEQDEDFRFGGLGNVIRKCRTDFGIEIDLPIRALEQDAETKHSCCHSALGTINYPEGRKGWILYIKSSLTGRESTDILEYKLREDKFPHQSTADQWFDESQFESYRQLGYEIAMEVLKKPAKILNKCDIAMLFKNLNELRCDKKEDNLGASSGKCHKPEN